MDGLGIQSILAETKKPVVVKLGGIEHLALPNPDGSYAVDQSGPDAIPTPIGVATLSGVVDYLKENRDQLALAHCAVHVVSHAEVRVLGPLEDAPFRQRSVFLLAGLGLFGTGFPFGQYHDPDTFNVALQTQFVDSDDRAKVLSLVGNITDQKVATMSDDGVTQTVGVQAGVVLRSEASVPNPVTLRPFRTFRDIEQPASKFVLRVNGGKEGAKPTCALFEADGSAWKLEAIKGIREFLNEKLAGAVPVIA